MLKQVQTEQNEVQLSANEVQSSTIQQHQLRTLVAEKTTNAEFISKLK